MSNRSWIIAAIAVVSACSSAETPSAPSTEPPSLIAPAGGHPSDEGGRRDRLARRFAKALRDPGFRHRIHQALAGSTNPEGKIHLQGLLDRNGGAERRSFFELAGDPPAETAADLDQGSPIEVYLPVAAHRRTWTGDPDVLVASAETDTDAPVGYDLRGRRVVLDPRSPPSTPVIAVNRAELDFSRGPQALSCLFDCGGGGVTPPSGQGVYLTQTSFNGTFEGWLKGDPEFEIHILGPSSTGSAAMTTYQCIGANVGAPYAWDQNGKTWTGNVLLFSQAQIDQFKAQNPGQGFRIAVVEDDDTACQIKIDSSRVANMLNAIKIIYGDLTGAKDTTGSGVKWLEKAPSWLKVLKAVTSFFLTNDEPVGHAVKDSVVASAYFRAANWAIRGENTVVNGAIRLEMR